MNISDVVLEARPWPRGASRTEFCVLGLKDQDIGLGLDLEGCLWTELSVLLLMVVELVYNISITNKLK